MGKVRQAPDPEIAAMRKVLQTLLPLTPPQRFRVARWVLDKCSDRLVEEQLPVIPVSGQGDMKLGA